MSALAKGRMSVAAGCVGIAQAALDAAVRYAGEREQFGKTIAHHQLVQELISDIAVDVDAARLLTWRVADLIDRGQPFAVESSKAKLFASEAAVRAANNALQVYGDGYIDDTRGALATPSASRAADQKLVIGRALTGVSAF
ncbi:acyl-CoA dehydrogenase family protein [Streptomyces hirsutus]